VWGGTDRVAQVQSEVEVDRGSKDLDRKTEARFRIGQRATWKNAPGWWNPQGEEIYEVGDDFVRLHYGGLAIPFSEVIILD